MDAKIEIRKIISAVSADPDVQAILGGRIYFGLPAQSAAPYAVVSLLSDVDSGGNRITHARARLEFRFVGAEKSPLSVLHDAEHAVAEAMLSIADFEGFRPFRITRGQTLATGYSEDSRPALVRDFIVHYCR